MTKKDPNTAENIDRNKKAQEDWDSHHTTTDRYPEEAKGIGETEIKNAHASGDGAYGHNESGVYDDTGKSKEEPESESSY